MTGEAIANLINIGTAGAVIAVVIIFLRFIKERDADWRSFFTTIRRSDNELNARLAMCIERLENKFDAHDATEMEFLRGLVGSPTQPIRKKKSNDDPGAA